MEQLIMCSGDATVINLERGDNQFLIQGHDGKYVMFVPRAESGKQMPLIAAGELTIAQIESVYGDIASDNLQVLGIVVDTLCQADRCRYF